jgi:hypothetical protein
MASPRSPSNRRLGLSQDRDGKFGEEKYSSILMGIKGFLNRSARNQFTTVTELSSLTSAKENKILWDEGISACREKCGFIIKICKK